MRCPECEQRNSVAAWKCKFCGAKFKRKQMSPGKKIVLLTCGAVLGGSIYLAFALPKLVDPAEQLMSVAKRVASGPTSPEDAKKAREAFDEAVKNLLTRYGGENSGLLSKRLKACLPPAAFEVLVADLPKGLRLVEIDTVLQASDFLVLKGTNDTKVFPLTGFEVYDDARAVDDQTGSVVVLIGHTGGQPPHKPLVHTYAMLPDSIIDETANMVPSIAGEGTAKFAKDSSDINVELSMPSVAQSEKIKVNPALTPDKVMRINLKWKDKSKYVPTAELPQDPSAGVMLVARSLKHPEYAAALSESLGPQCAKLIKENTVDPLQEISVQKNGEAHKGLQYTITSAKKKIDLEIKRTGNSWSIASFNATTLATPTNIAASTATNPATNPISTNTSTPAGTQPLTNTATNTSIASTTSSTSPSAVPDKPNPDKSNEKIDSKGSSWLDDEHKDDKPNDKTPVAVLPNAVKNAQAEKEKLEKEKRDKEQKDKEQKDKEQKAKEKQDKEQKEKDRKAKEQAEKEAKAKADKEKSEAETSASGSARIADYLGTSSVRLRSGPGLNSQTLDEIPKGTKVQIIGKKKDWYKISYKGKTGYVFSPLVDTKGSAAASKPEKAAQTTVENVDKPSTAQPPSSGTGAVVKRPMTVRSESRRAISSVKVGEHVVVLSGLQNNRYKIRKDDGTVGYVNKDAIDVKVETPPEFVP